MRFSPSRLAQWILSVCLILLLLGVVVHLVEGRRSRAGQESPLAMNSGRATTSPAEKSSSTRPSKSGRVSEKREGLNAADLYKSAFALLNALSPEDWNVLLIWDGPEDTLLSSQSIDEPILWRTAPDNPRAAELYQKVQPIMDLLRRAAAEANYCDWSQGPAAFGGDVGYLKAEEKLAQVARWEVEQRFYAEPDGALTDVKALMALGQNAGANDTLELMNADTINTMAVGALRAHSADLSPEGVATALDLLKAFNPADNLASAMGGEASMIASLAAGLQNPATRDETVKSLLGRSSISQQDLQGEQSVPFTEQARWAGQIATEFAQKATLPDADFQAWWSSVTAQAASQPLAEEALRWLQHDRQEIQFTQVNRALLAAGLAVQQGNAESLASIPDPSSGQPFRMTQTDSGFQLQSGFISGAEPLTMAFSQRAP